MIIIGILIIHIIQFTRKRCRPRGASRDRRTVAVDPGEASRSRGEAIPSTAERPVGPSGARSLCAARRMSADMAHAYTEEFSHSTSPFKLINRSRSAPTPERSGKERPVSRQQGIDAKQGVGRGVGADGVAERATSVIGQGVEHPRHRPLQPSIVQHAEGDG
jgi:hypothetical protein